MQKKLTLIIIFAFILLINCAHQGFSQQTQTIIEKGKLSSKELKNLIDSKNKDYMLIDVRSKGEYNGGYIPTAINIPVNTIEENTNKIPKNKLIIVYCKVGGRAESAKRSLKKLGYKNVINFGGTNDWKYELVK